MHKSRYLLSQQFSCKTPGTFAVHQLPQPDNRQQEQHSQTSNLQIIPQQNVGQFIEEGCCWFCCCSFRPIKSIEMQIYGQKLSRATSESKCCLNICGSKLAISTTKDVLIGTINKMCGCSGSIVTIGDQNGKQLFQIRAEGCQCASICPRWLKCTAQKKYSIFDGVGKEVGSITTVYRSFMSNICGQRDQFQVIFTDVDRERDKILILNAVVFINQLKHEWL